MALGFSTPSILKKMEKVVAFSIHSWLLLLSIESPNISKISHLKQMFYEKSMGYFQEIIKWYVKTLRLEFLLVTKIKHKISPFGS